MKEMLYKTAYSPLYKCYVGITHAYKDCNDKWIFEARLEDGCDLILFRKEELIDFVL